MSLHRSWPGWVGYLIVGSFGAVLFCAYWWLACVLHKPLEAQTKVPVSIKPNDKPTSITPPEQGKELTSQPSKPSTPKPVADIRIASQKQIASADSTMPYGLEVVVTTDKDVSPVALNFIFSGEVAKVQAIPVLGQFIEEQGGIVVAAPNVVFYQRKSPAFVCSSTNGFVRLLKDVCRNEEY